MKINGRSREGIRGRRRRKSADKSRIEDMRGSGEGTRRDKGVVVERRGRKWGEVEEGYTKVIDCGEVLCVLLGYG